MPIMSKRIENFKNIEKRINTVKSWATRLEVLKSRKENPITREYEFARKYGIDPAYFNRLKNLKCIPNQSTVDMIESYMQKEGV